MSVQFKTITLIAALCAVMVTPLTTQASGSCSSCGSPNASEALSLGAGLVVLGSMSMIEGSGKVVIDTVKSAADGVTVVLKGSTEAASATIKLSGKGIQNAALVSGAVVEVSATTTGYLLVSAGKVLAFIPNELGNALMHHNKV